MDSVLSVIEPQYESFTIDKSVGRLSDEINQFNQDASNVLPSSLDHSVECRRVLERHYWENSERVRISESVGESSRWHRIAVQRI